MYPHFVILIGQPFARFNYVHFLDYSALKSNAPGDLVTVTVLDMKQKIVNAHQVQLDRLAWIVLLIAFLRKLLILYRIFHTN